MQSSAEQCKAVQSDAMQSLIVFRVSPFDFGIKINTIHDVDAIVQRTNKWTEIRRKIITNAVSIISALRRFAEKQHARGIVNSVATFLSSGRVGVVFPPVGVGVVVHFKRPAHKLCLPRGRI